MAYVPKLPACPECGRPCTHGQQHTCDIDERWQYQRKLELEREVAKAQEEMARPDNVAATLQLWGENATTPPCPDEDAADVSLPARRKFAKWQREHEEGLK